MPEHTALDPPSVELVNRYRDGDGGAAAEIHERFCLRLAALARSKLSPQLAARVDAEDVVQSAMLSFFDGCRTGELAVEQPGDLWKLLAAITLNKVRRQVEHHLAAKRSVRRETPCATHEHDPGIAMLDREPSAADVVIVREEIARLFKRLDPLQRRAVEMRLAGRDTAEIATELGPTERTIRRWIALVERMLQASHVGANDSVTVPAPRHQRAWREQLQQPWIDYRDLLLERQIGRGGVGRVYRAFHRSTGRMVAVKALTSRSCRSEALRDAFFREAQTVARFSHPAIVPLLGIGQLPNGNPFLVLEFVAGQNLAQVLAEQGPILLPQAAKIVATVADALQYAHQLGVVHGDVKPANVMVNENGQVMLTDFGFAVLMNEQATGQASGGTVGYLAPEQIDPSVGAIGSATDIYGLGALLATLLTGRSPSPGEMFSVGEEHGAAIGMLIESCLDLCPGKRPVNARVVAETLGSIRARGLIR